MLKARRRPLRSGKRAAEESNSVASGSGNGHAFEHRDAWRSHFVADKSEPPPSIKFVVADLVLWRD
jgi:hypothetical protein